MHQNLVQDPFLILVNNPEQPLHARNFSKRKDILKENYQKVLKKLTFLFKPSLFSWTRLYKRGLELVTSLASGYKRSSKTFLY